MSLCGVVDDVVDDVADVDASAVFSCAGADGCCRCAATSLSGSTESSTTSGVLAGTVFSINCAPDRSSI